MLSHAMKVTKVGRGVTVRLLSKLGVAVRVDAATVAAVGA